MANLRDIKRRIASVKSTKQIAHTMEMVSTAKIIRALENASAAKPYKDAITLMLANVASAHLDVQEPLLRKHAQVKHVVLLVIASDRGLAGGFNITLQRAADAKRRELEAQGIRVSFILCGKKPTEYFKFRNVNTLLSFTGVSSEPTMAQADKIASHLIHGYCNNTIDSVIMYYQHAKNRVEQIEVIEQLLPIEPREMKIPAKPRYKEKHKIVSHTPVSSYDFVPSAVDVLGYLLPAYIRTVIYHALLDSAAAEHGARRRAMQAAADNASEVITTLSRSYNRIRQSSITTELNEIVGGASALEEM